MSRSQARRGVAAVGVAAMVPLGLMIVGGGAANAAPASVDWWDGNSHFTRTISNAMPAVGEVVTTSTKFERKAWTSSEILHEVKDVHPTCLTYVEGSAKVDGKAQGLDSKGADFAKVKGSWTVYPNIEPKSHTFEFSYTVGADCARGAALPTSMHYSGGLGSGTYNDKGPAITVAKNASTTTLAAVTDAKVGKSSQLTATVTGGAAGNPVEFYDGATKIGAGPLAGNSVSIAWTPTTAGDHGITAKFLATGSANESTSAAQTVTVAEADVETTTALAVPASAVTGAAVELTATVSPAPAGGTVQFKDGDANIGGPVAVSGGVATLSHAFDAAGGRSITAVYSGAGGFLTSTSAAASITVTDPAPVDVETTVLAAAPTTAKVGAAVDLSATVTPTTAQGTVQFKDGDTAIGAPVAIIDGAASLSHTFDASGTKSITAVFVGGPGYLNSTSQPVTVTVSEPLPTDVETATTLVVPAAATVGQTVTLTAQVAPAAAGGTVQFKDGDRAIGLPAPIVDGKATLSYSFPTAGAKNITAVYSGGTGFTPSTSAAGVVTVSAAPAQGGGSLENIFGS
ncbi:Ig-like domain-containing protein [Rhodococcus sp. NPDC058532]|uniref:Ig-like domain-containing protein n=1 Tax=Rhodococcus sp. NPDC058532 TaxID=3346540 RepID=UPI00365FF9AB